MQTTQQRSLPKVSKETQETLRTLKLLGVKFNIVTPVDRRLELHYSYRNQLTGKECTNFVAELDGYGNITEEGPVFKNSFPNLKMNDFVLNADGERV